jgi:nudix motif 8
MNTLNRLAITNLKQAITKHIPRTRFKSKATREAAVLIPLCIVDKKPSILFTVRSTSLREHHGEVSFPGGMKDEEDENIIETATRETFEEIEISRNEIEILGTFVQLPNRSGRVRVTSVVGYLGSIQPSLIRFNKSEVSSVFTVDIETLLQTKEWENFREQGIDIPSWSYGEHRIWGLTGYILNEFLTVFKALK